jgi:hypothetical protein
LARNNIIRIENSILGHCNPNRLMKPRSQFMIDNNPRLGSQNNWLMKNRPHDENYNPIFFIPVMAPPRPPNSELPQIEE